MKRYCAAISALLLGALLCACTPAERGVGELLPYAGLRLMDDWPAHDGCLYGLMTRQGVAVTDAVFSTVVFHPNGFPLLVLRRVEENWARIAVAGADGS